MRNAPSDPFVALCLETYDDPIGVGVSYERGTPVVRDRHGASCGQRAGISRLFTVCTGRFKYRDTSLIRNRHPPRAIVAPWA